MQIFQSIILGVIQGFTEFLPISSSGHLVLVPHIFGWRTQDMAFDVIVHLATFVAVVYVFWKDILRMGKAVLGKGSQLDKRLGWLIVAATVPVVGFGLLLKDHVEFIREHPEMVALLLIVWGVVLGAADIIQRIYPPKIKSEMDIGWRRGIAVGFAQALAIIPGTSRSGITMTAALLMGIDRKTAARFSFLLSVPAVGGAAIYVILDAIRESVVLFTPEVVIGFVASLIAGIVGIRFLLKVVEQWTFLPFAIYRVVLGLIILSLVI